MESKFREYFARRAVDAISAFENYICDACECAFDASMEIWSGVNYGNANCTVCGDCKRSDKPIPNTFYCDYEKWKMFKDTPTVYCQFDVRIGWYRDLESDEDLCPTHGDKILKSDDPDLLKWRKKFQWVNVANLTMVDLTKRFMLGSDRDNYVGADVPVLVLPETLTWESLEPTFNEFFQAVEPYKEPSMVEKEAKEKDEKQWTNDVCWDSIVAVDHTRCRNEAEYLGINAAEWVPFEISKDGQYSDFSIALVNCNRNNVEDFGKVATAVADDHGRVGFHRLDMSYEDYMDGKKVWRQGDNISEAKNFIEYVRHRAGHCFYYG